MQRDLVTIKLSDCVRLSVRLSVTLSKKLQLGPKAIKEVHYALSNEAKMNIVHCHPTGGG